MPEQARGEQVDFRADIFSVGVILAEAMMKRPYWGEASDPVISARLVQGDLPKVEGPDLDQRLLEICNQALTPGRTDRLTSAAEFKVLLDWYLEATGGQVSREAIADFVQPLVADDRAKIKTLLDQQMKTPQGASTINSRLDLPFLEQATPRSRESAVVQVPPIPPMEPLGAVTGRGGTPVSERSVRSAARPEDPAAKPKWPLAVAGVAVLAIAGAGFVVVSNKPQAVQAPAAVVAPPPAPAAAAPVAVAPTPAPEPVRAPEPVKPEPTSAPGSALTLVNIAVSPSSARLSIDGSPLDHNPFSGSFPRDSQEHTLVAEADGYRPVTTHVSFERDVVINLTLLRQPGYVAPPVARTTTRSRPNRPDEAEQAPDKVDKADKADKTTIQEIKPQTPSKTDNKRSLDSDVFDAEKKRTLDRDNPW